MAGVLYNSYEDWAKSFEGLEFEQSSAKMRDWIIEKGNLDEKSVLYFKDCYDYMLKLVNLKKPLEMNLFKIYLEDVKGYESVKMEDVIRVMMLLAICGFSIEKK